MNQIIDIRNRADFPADQETSLTAPYAVIVKKLGDLNSIVEANRMMENLSKTITKTDPVYNMQYAITDYASIAALSDDRGHRLNALRFVYHWYQQYKDYDFGLAPAFATLYASIATPGRVASSSGMYRSNLEQAEPDQQRLAWSRGLAILLGARMKITQGDARKALVLDALQMMRSPMVSDPMPYVDAIEGLSGPLADRRPDTALAWAQKAYGIRREDLRPR